MTTRVYRLALATVLATLALIALGSIARLHPAGSGCGNDWPRCNGSWLPPLGWEPLVEYAHRGVALAVIVFAAATAVVAVRAPGTSQWVRRFALASIGVILLQSAIGGYAAVWGAPAGIATLHLALAMLFLSCAVATLTATAAQRGAPEWLAGLGRVTVPPADRLFALVAALGAGVAYALVMFGASTSASGAFACATWPLCGDAQSLGAETAIHLGYRATAFLGTLAAVGTALLAWRREATSTARRLAAAAVLLVAVQTGMNALATLAGDPAWISAPHLLVATLIWLAMLGIAVAAWSHAPAPVAVQHALIPERHDDAPGHEDAPIAPPMATGAVALAAPAPGLGFGLTLPRLARPRQIITDYVALTKPGIMSLLLTTTLCAMLMAARGFPPFRLVAITLLGGMLASGGANVLNCYIDRDIDEQMPRTRHRATVSGRVSPDAALAFGITLTAASVLLLGLMVNWTAAALALAGNLFYVLIYTKWLKRATPYNIVIGGAAGAVPPLVGWAAVNGDLSPLAWGLFAIIFAWTPPHFWALALLKQGEYTRASVPMLPVVRGEVETRRQILIYTAILALVCLALTPLGLGTIYFVAALLLNGIFLGLAVRLYVDPSKRIARQMFFYSLWYLALVFAAAVIDRILIA
jgi:heme o synthase